MQLALGFDFDHTLGIDNKLERTVALEIVERLSRLRGLEYSPEHATAVVESSIQIARRGETPVETALTGVLLQLVGPGPENTGEAANFRDAVTARCAEFVQPLPGAREMLDALDALGVRYALLSNGWSPLQEEKARALGFKAPVYVSERIGAWKPAAEAFTTLIHLFDLPPSAIWYVGDDPVVDCGGARAAGLRSVWYDWEGRTYPDGVARPDFVIHALAELPALVQGHLAEAAKAPG
jgi:HAD superfamily hydrolase (TIGR01509 family)